MLTIFTPTYNRVELLQLLKASLDRQSDTDFEWIILDDGSTDDTSKVVNDWLQCDRYPIRYCKQKNSGKHIAFNKAVKMAKGDIFICVDSDDQLLPKAVEMIKSDFLKLSPSNVGVVSPRVNKKGECEKNWSRINFKEIDIIDLKELYGIVESAIAIRTSVLKRKEPFVKFQNEKFLPESWLYLDLCKEGKFLVNSKGYYISEYQETGLTKNLWKHWKNNYQGILATLRKKYEISQKYNFCKRKKVQAKIILNMNSLCFSTHINIFEVTPSKIESCILFIPAWIICNIRYNKV